jgi:hypothetical protein
MFSYININETYVSTHLTREYEPRPYSHSLHDSNSTINAIVISLPYRTSYFVRSFPTSSFFSTLPKSFPIYPYRCLRSKVPLYSGSSGSSLFLSEPSVPVPA